MGNQFKCRISRVKFKSGGSIHVLPPIAKPDNECVDLLLDALSFARSGDIKSVAIVGFSENGVVLNNYHLAKGESFMGLIGTIERLKGRILDDFNHN